MWYHLPLVATGSIVENGSLPTKGDAPISKDSAPPGSWRISQSPVTPIKRPRTASTPAPRIQKATVPSEGGENVEFVWATALTPLVCSALLPAHSVSQVAPPERLAA